MPLFMPRPSPSWIVIVVSLGGMLPAARAADPPCPTQVVPAGAPPAAAGAAPEPKPLRGEGNISLDSDQATLGADNSMTLEGNVVVRQGEREIRANEVHYNPQDSSLSAPGHIDYSDPLVSVTGAGGSYSTAAGADFKSAEFALRQRAARGAAQDMTLTPQGVIRLRRVMFTTCPAKDSSWQLKADSIVLDTRNRVGTGRDAQVDFMGVPLVYLPWVSFPLGTERKSGFLFPGIGNTSYAGLQLSVPYYWNIAPNADFTFQPIEYSRSGPDLGGDLRFLTPHQRGEVDWNYLPNDGAFHGSRSRVRLSDVAELPDDFRLSVKAENVSDPFYFEDFSQGPEGTSTAFIERRATLAVADAADRELGHRPGVRARQRLAQAAQADARATHPVPRRPLSQPGPAAGVRQRASGPQSRGAVSHQPLCRRRPRQRCQPGECRPHQPPAGCAQRPPVPGRHLRAVLHLRDPASDPARGSSDERQALGFRGDACAHRLSGLERCSQ